VVNPATALMTNKRNLRSLVIGLMLPRITRGSAILPAIRRLENALPMVRGPVDGLDIPAGLVADADWVIE
jgi:hypothetical protein